MRAAVLLAALAAACSPGAEGGAARRPDILLVSVDTLRADRLSCYGNPNATTPFLDRMASEGARFERALAPATNTTPSHMSLFTGLDPMTHGVHPARPSNKPTAALSERVRTLPQVLRAAGWRTAAFTDRGGLPPSVGFGRGFEHLRSEWESLAAKVDAVGAFLAAAPAEEPLFLFFHTYEVHAPYLPPPGFHGRFAPPGYAGRFAKRYENLAGLPVDKAWDQKAFFLAEFDGMGDEDVAWLSAVYDEGVAYADSQLARLWELWTAARGADETLLVVLSDHGEEFREHDGLGHHVSLHTELVRVPLIFRGPGVGRGVVEAPVSLTSVLPTLLEYLGLPVRERLQSPSLLPALERPGAPGELGPVFAQTDNKRNLRLESVLAGDLRLLRVTRPGSKELRLFDWSADPAEARDRAAERAADVERLERLLDARLAECEELRERLGPNPERVLSEREIAELKGLGYVDGE